MAPRIWLVSWLICATIGRQRGDQAEHGGAARVGLELADARRSGALRIRSSSCSRGRRPQ